jgi:hypothetical protein
LKILLDHNLDRRLKRHLTQYEVSTALDEGWADVLNGELLGLLDTNGFDVLITADSNIKNQQNLKGRTIAVLIIRAPNNRLSTHMDMISEIIDALSGITPGEFLEVHHK